MAVGRTGDCRARRAALGDCPPALQRVGIGALAARREDPGPKLEEALRSADGRCARGRRGRRGSWGGETLLPLLRSEARLDESEAGAQAAWAAVLLGDTGVLPELWRAASAGGSTAVAAADLAVRCVEAPESAERLLELSRAPGTLRAALAGAAARGDSSCIPWVLAVMEREPTMARHAMWAVSTITGALPVPPLAVRGPTDVPPDEALRRAALDPWEDLPAPIAAAWRAHWEEVGSRHAPGERRLGGRQIDAAWLAHVLRAGRAPWRASAAIEQMRASAGDGLFPVHAPAPWQMARLSLPGTSGQ
ncbi:MAG: hypothetical protein R3B70_47135 [Polyangiaceae bacterium]